MRSAAIGLLWLAVTVSIPSSSPTAEAAGGRDKPRVAVLEFKNKADNQWWWHGGAEAAQDVFVTELVKSGKYTVLNRKQLQALMKEKNLTLSGDVDPSTAARAGKSLGVNYILTGTFTQYGVTDSAGGSTAAQKDRRPGVRGAGRPFVATAQAKLIDTSTGEIVWADEARHEEQVSVGGFGGGVDDDRLFNRTAKPAVQQLSRKLGTAKLR